MKALILTAVGETAIQEIDIPVPGPEEVLLRIGMVGFCGGDLNGFKGLFELQEYPNVLGHEVGGTVEQTGANVPATYPARHERYGLSLFELRDMYFLQKRKDQCLPGQ
jgi:D-arabinose 1-dehydrogenase-like Zn-dependent alcohol dehydrogenase